MMRFHFRIRAKQSLVDLHPELIEKQLHGLYGIELIRIIDDRLADGVTLTLILKVVERSDDVLVKLKQALLKLPKVTVNIMDKSGKESNLALLDTEGIRGFEVL